MKPTEIIFQFFEEIAIIFIYYFFYLIRYNYNFYLVIYNPLNHWKKLYVSIVVFSEQLYTLLKI